jgi:hypothetical protein
MIWHVLAERFHRPIPLPACGTILRIEDPWILDCWYALSRAAPTLEEFCERMFPPRLLLP